MTDTSEKKDILIHVEDLNIEFHDHSRPETVVHDLDMDICRGEILGIVGESGSGKSMTALAVAGLLNRHDMSKSGHIIYDGKDILNCPRDEIRKLQGSKIGMIFQEPMTSLDPAKKIGWQIEESLRLHTDLGAEQRHGKAVEFMEKAGLQDAEKLFDEYPHELSGGMRQRVMIAAAMICGPELLIADEPTTALDVTVQAQIIELLREINRDGHTAVLFISHDLSLVRRLCTRVIVMNEGRLVEEGDVNMVYDSPKEEYTKQLIAAIPKIDAGQRRTAAARRSQGMASDDSSILRTEGLNVYAGKRRILSDISFEMHRGEILGLVGESGCGKTTLARALVGMNRNTEGHINHMTRYPQMVFQDPYSSLNPSRSIEWILEEPLKNRSHLTPAERREAVDRMLKAVDMPAEMKERYPGELSGGQRQRISIACALMQTPELLIADEPVSALDVTVQKQILQLLSDLKDKMGLTILFISHDLRVVYGLCDHVMIMHDGRIVEHGETEKVYSEPESAYTRQLMAASGIN